MLTLQVQKQIALLKGHSSTFKKQVNIYKVLRFLRLAHIVKETIFFGSKSRILVLTNKPTFQTVSVLTMGPVKGPKGWFIRNIDSY